VSAGTHVFLLEGVYSFSKSVLQKHQFYFGS
jgi:hypothetical protein